MPIFCSLSVIDATLNHLKEAGHLRKECVVLWLGQLLGSVIRIQEVHRPLHIATSDMFWIPPESMSALQVVLRKGRFMIAAQVHSHPQEAFHSKADDRWAIVRHEGALSIVVPNFSMQTTGSSFLDDIKVYRFSSSAKWKKVPREEVESSCLRIG